MKHPVLIKTKNKNTFLKNEYKEVFSNVYQSLYDFNFSLGEYVIKCEKCGIYYWEGNKKACKCL